MSTTKFATYAALPPLPHAKTFFSEMYASITKSTNFKIPLESIFNITSDDSFLYNLIKSK